MRAKRPSPEILEHYRQMLIALECTPPEMAERLWVAEFTTFRSLGPVRNMQESDSVVVDRRTESRERELAKRERLRAELK